MGGSLEPLFDCLWNKPANHGSEAWTVVISQLAV